MTQAIIDVRFARAAKHDPLALQRGKWQESQSI
jgi:hypothetical protein